MNRTALRLATKAALLGGGAAPYPTLAGANVFDSRNEPISDLTAEERVPVIVLRTDEDRRFGTIYKSAVRRLEMRIEASVLTARKEADGSISVGWPATDAGIEAFLDLLEYQITVALFGDDPWAEWWRRWKVDEVVSQPVFTSPEEGRVKLAVRELTIRFDGIQNDCLPPPVIADDLSRDTNDEPILPTAVLPKRLTDVFDKIAADGAGDLKTSAAQIRAMLEAQTLPPSTAYPLLKRVYGTIPVTVQPEPVCETSTKTFEADFLDT